MTSITLKYGINTDVPILPESDKLDQKPDCLLTDGSGWKILENKMQVYHKYHAFL